MAIRIIYILRCEHCNFEADKKENLIFNRTIPEEEFQKMQVNEIASLVMFYYQNEKFKCPNCKTINEFSIIIDGRENIKLKTSESFGVSVLRKLSNINSSDFIKCKILDFEIFDDLMADEKVRFKIRKQNDQLTLLIEIDDPEFTNMGTLIFEGISNSCCYERESESYHKPYILFQASDQNQIVLMEWNEFHSLLATERFFNPDQFSIKNLTRIDGLSSFIQ